MVIDEEFRERGAELQADYDFLCGALDEYVQIVGYLAAQMEGEAAASLAALADSIGGISAELPGAGAGLGSCLDSFVSDIDAADSFIY
jgi:hypothetical protein